MRSKILFSKFVLKIYEIIEDFEYNIFWYWNEYKRLFIYMNLKNYIYNKCENKSMMVKNISNLNDVQFLIRN